MARLRVVVLCPGRGSYGRDELGSLAGRGSRFLDAFDALRAARGRPTVRALDAEPRYSARLHVAGEHASALTAGVTLTDFDGLDPAKVEVVAVAGNSMGWYTALGAAGALSPADTAVLVDTMGSYQEGNVRGGQAVYPLVGEDWRPDAILRAAAESALAEIPGLYASIRLGGQLVFGGTDEALAALGARVPAVQRGALTYPLRLPLHSAFHTPLLSETARRAQAELGGLGWSAPEIPLVDGLGRVWNRGFSSPDALRDYTLGPQVDDVFDFTAMMRVALGEFAPDAVVLPGPGSNLGGAVAQVMIGLGWAGLRSKDDFTRRQAERPVVIALRRPEQAALALA